MSILPMPLGLTSPRASLDELSHGKTHLSTPFPTHPVMCFFLGLKH